MSDDRDAGFRLLRSIHLRDLLSFGPEGIDLDLPALTVLIGPNGSGKSNLFEALVLLHASPSQLAVPVRDGGGIRNWLWNRGRDATARIEAVVEYPKGKQTLRHVLEFSESDQTLRLVDERVENELPYPGYKEPYFFYRFQAGRPMLAVKGENSKRALQPDDVVYDESILSQRKDPDQYPELAHLNASYGKIRLYREWEFGRHAVLRQPHPIDVRPRPLLEDFSNLGMFLSRLRQDQGGADRQALRCLRRSDRFRVELRGRHGADLLHGRGACRTRISRVRRQPEALARQVPPGRIVDPRPPWRGAVVSAEIYLGNGLRRLVDRQ